MVGILLSFWDGLFSGAMLVLGNVGFASKSLEKVRHQTSDLRNFSGEIHMVMIFTHGMQSVKKITNSTNLSLKRITIDFSIKFDFHPIFYLVVSTHLKHMSQNWKSLPGRVTNKKCLKPPPNFWSPK